MKSSILSCLIAFTALVSFAQDNLRFTAAGSLLMIGKAKPTDSIFQRIDAVETKDMPKSVQGLARNSAGIAILFETNSTVIRAKWKLANEVYLANMAPIGHSGLDLYCLKNGKWQFVMTGKPVKGVLEQDQVIIQHLDTAMKQFMLYLPLYNTVSDLQIGVQQSAIIRKPDHPGINTTKRVVMYGSSILQGASAGRPGMAYPAILQRKTGYDVINLGFSGSAKMEMELARYLASVPADLYILDCIPNPSPEQIKERSYHFIKYLREQKPLVPIILVETILRENGNWDQNLGKNVINQNIEIRRTYERLKKEGIKNFYYLTADKLIGNDHEATIDGVHLTDLGFMRMAEAVLPLIKKAMRKR